MNNIISRRLIVFALGALLMQPAVVLSQTRQRTVTEEANSETPRERMLVPFMEGTDVFLTSPTDTIFEARIAPHLIVKQTFGDVLDLPSQQARVAGGREAKHFGWIISGTPAIRLRELRQVSDPVRTPSYMPRVNMQLLYATGLRGKLDEHRGDAAKGSAPEIGVYEFHGIVGHHSNGQDGCLYTTQTRIGNAEDCTPPLAPDAARAQQIINRHDGSFSTNYVRAGLNYRRTRVDSSTLVDDQDWTVGIELEQNFSMDPNVFPLYGRTRLTASAGFAGRPSAKSDHWWDREHWWTCDARREIKGSLKYINGNPSTVWPVALTAEADCFPSTEGGWGFFVRYYAGQDYYNLGFLDNIHRWQAGATFTQDGFFRFRRTPAQ
jgi:hypothetical protein